MSVHAARFSLRDLPIPAKLVITCFLLAVGGGYSAAMVQLHMQDSKSGEPMPTVHDVILKYTGKKWFENPADRPEPISTFVKLITAPEVGPPFNGTGTMSPAFTTKDDGAFNRINRVGPSQAEQLRSERLGERDVLVLWAKSPPDERKKTYNDDHFGIDDASKQPKAITKRFKSNDGAYPVKLIIDERCARCHKPEGDDSKAAQFPLTNYEQIEKYLVVSDSGTVGPHGGWVRVCEPIGLEKLTQSTHAHLLSFAVLFALTGLTFAFTSFPTTLRCILGPWVLIAVVADVSLWWLARLSDEYGPYFAMGIIGTGAAAGVGLMLQITLSLLNMYGPKGKLVILLLFLLAGAGAGMLFKNTIEPGLKEKQRKLAEANTDANKKPGEAKKKDPEIVPSKLSPFQRVLQFPVKGPDGKDLTVLEIPFNKEPEKSMVRALFDKDSAEFAAAVKEKDMATQEKLTPLRHGEREGLLAWSKLPDAERQKAFDADAVELPSPAKQPVTPDYLDGNKLKVKSLITDRCIRCHDGEEKVQFSDYKTLLQYLK